MHQDLFVGLYVAGMVVVASVFVIRLWKARIRHLGDMLPGRVFRVMSDLNVLSKHQLDDRDEQVFACLLCDLRDIATELDGFIERKYAELAGDYARMRPCDEVRRIIRNSARCLRTFALTLRRYPRRQDMDFHRFNKAINDLVLTVNQYILQSYDIELFQRRVVVCKENVYFSLLGHRRPDQGITDQFIHDFKGLSRGEPLDAYLSKLRSEWLSQAKSDRLQVLDPRMIIPLFATWNVAKHMLTYSGGDDSKLELLDQWKRLVQATKDRDDFWRLAYIGLTYDQDEVVRRLLTCADVPFDQDKYIEWVLDQSLRASQGELEESSLNAAFA